MAHELVGGQALVEGVMIRQGSTWAAAARRADHSIATTVRESSPALRPIRSIPLLRGIGALVDSVSIGMAAMKWSKEASESTSRDQTKSTASPAQVRERLVVFAVVATVLLVFLLVPLWIASASHELVGRGWGAAAIEGLVRLALFVGYLFGLSKLPGIRRVLEYHGAEHMVIAAHEHAEPRTIDAARRHSPRHPRCGTDFFLLIFVISIVAFALVGHLPALWLVISRVLLAPVVVGVAYEILRAGGTSSHSGLAAVLSAPGLFLQRFTTREPDDAQIEVALAALETMVPTTFEIGAITSTVSV